jgi:hypothetical protein
VPSSRADYANSGIRNPVTEADDRATTDEEAAVTPDESTIRPFRVDIPDADLADLRRRIAATRFPSKELVDDRSQGVQLATTEELARYWSNDYDWHRCEDRLNARPQFLTKIDGVDIHFIHVESPHANALPLIMTHSMLCCRRSRATASRANRARSDGTPAAPQVRGRS